MLVIVDIHSEHLKLLEAIGDIVVLDVEDIIYWEANERATPPCDFAQVHPCVTRL